MKTAREWLDAWDRGETVWSVEMSGMGPGYEQAIQRLAVEMVRDSNCVCPPMDDPKIKDNSWRDDTVSRLDGEPWAGFSGAQVGAAKSLAIRILRDGPEGVRASLVKQGILDRHIQVSKAAI